MLGNWAQQISAWLLRKTSSRARRRANRWSDGSHQAAMVKLFNAIESLESRQMLTNLVSVSVQGNNVTLNDASRGRVSTGDDFTLAYTAKQITLTGTNGTSFKVGNQTMSTYTVNVTSPDSISMHLNANANAVTISGDGTSKLGSISVNLGSGKQNNSLTLSKVIADSLTVHGGRHDDTVTLKNSTISGNLSANLGSSGGDKLDLENSTVNGNVRDWVSQLVMNQSTISGSLNDVESSSNASINSTSSTYTGRVTISMGRNGTINMSGSSSGANHFHGAVSITGVRRHEITDTQQGTSAVVYDVAPKLNHVNQKTVAPKITAPTVNALNNVINTPTITGTYDSVNGPNLTVAVNGTTYTLGSSTQLTTPSTGTWSLNLTGTTPLPTGSTTVTVTSSDNKGDSAQGTGTVTTSAQTNSELPTIHSFETKNNLTATQTDSGLNYVITTKGTGALPKAGQTLTVNYSGFLLNSDGTQGTEFDSNVDSQFKHVSPFTFKLGAGAVIAGWDEAFALLPVGSVAKLIIPSALAYGTTGQGSSIPGNSILIFNVTLVSAS